MDSSVTLIQTPKAEAPRTLLKLTRRWQPLKPHREQSRLWNHPARFKMVPAGRQSGKTEIAKRKLILSLWDTLANPRPWFDPRFFAAAPTRDHAKKIWWNDLKAMTPPGWLDGSPRESDLTIRTFWGAELSVVGLDKPQRIEGVTWDGGVVDEYADTKPGTFEAHIRPALAIRNGWLWFIGVPDMMGPAQSEYQDLYDVALSGADPEWAAFNWASADIMPASEIESAKRRTDPRLFEQEYLGRFVLSGGRAFPDFDIEQHAGKPVAYDAALPLCWSLDFNINPMCSGVIQHHRGEVRVIHELELPDTKTDTACDTFLAMAKERGWNLSGLCVYGDATGNARDTTSGTTDWVIVANRLKNVQHTIKVPAASPSIKDTVNAVNGRLKSADGAIHLAIDPNCSGLIRDLRSAIAGTDMEPQHHVSWLRYFCEWEYPVQSQQQSIGRVSTGIARRN
jgi:hypothetical protein